ncbi:MAG TPA: VWA domain-containing protein [Myxococcota bacterium]|nr:VWA domain-containing protein [Myxococcota bacterium]
MNLAHPSLLPLLLVLPLVLVLIVWGLRERRRLLGLLLSPEMQAQLIDGGVAWRRRAQAWLSMISLSFLLLAAIGPQWGFEWLQQRMEGVTIVVLLDASRSMDATDQNPSRMDLARRKLIDFSNLLRGDAVGLVLFAGGAYTRLPPTVDYRSFRWALGDSSTDTLRAQGTALSGAFDIALKMLQRAEGSGKAILLVSDGEFHDEEAPLQAAVARLAEAGIRVYALGVGTEEGAPIPLPEGGFKEDASGNVVVSKAAPERLRALAAATGGAYVQAVASEEDVQMLYEGEIRGKLQAQQRGVRDLKRWHDRYQWPLAVALFAAAASAFLGIRPGAFRFRRSGTAALVLLCLLLPTAAYAGAASDGLAAFNAQRWEDAIPLLGQARVEDPSDTRVARALAESLYRSGRYREAEQVYRSLAAQAGNPKEKAAWDYNAGRSAYQGGRLNESLQAFQEAAKGDPELAAAAHNAEVVQKELQMRLQQQPPPDEQQQDPQDQGGEDQQQQAGQQGDQPQQPQQSQPGEQDQQGQPKQDPKAQQGNPQNSPDGTREAAPPPPQGEPGSQPPENGGEQPAQIAEGGGTPEEEGTEDPDKMTAEQAARLVDGVQEGRPQVVVTGAAQGKDW